MADETTGTGSTPAVTAQPKPAETFQRLLEKNDNDAIKLASQLFDENYTHRNTIRELTGKQPVDGAVVLSPEDAKRWRAFAELGVEVDTVKTALEKIPELEKTAKEYAQAETLRELADVGLDGSKLKLSVLKDRLEKFPDAEITFKTQKDKDGNDTKAAFIKTGDKEEPFDAFAKQHFADYFPALKRDESVATVSTSHKVIRQSPHTAPATPTVETEKEAQRSSGMYGGL